MVKGTRHLILSLNEVKEKEDLLKNTPMQAIHMQTWSTQVQQMQGNR
jgi:hypothetical protein